MKSVIKALFAIMLLSGITTAVRAQSSERPGKLEVSSHLQEAKGSYEERKLYREFLVEYMKNCPFISHFNIEESLDQADNHEVVWTYEVNSWDDITSFYNWVSKTLKSSKGEGLKKALTPYQPDYEIGGKIHVEKRDKSSLVKR